MTIINQSSKYLTLLSTVTLLSTIILLSTVPPGAPRMLDEDGRTVGKVFGPFFEVSFPFFDFCGWKSMIFMEDLFQGEEARLHCEVRGGGEIFSLLYNLRNHNSRATTALHHLGEGWSTCETSNSHKFSSGLDFVTCHSCHLKSMSLSMSLASNLVHCCTIFLWDLDWKYDQ